MLRAILLGCGNYQQCFQNCQRDADSNSTGYPERNDDVGVISLSKLHDASFGLVDGCKVIVLPSMSTIRIDSEDSRGRVQKPSDSKLMF